MVVRRMNSDWRSAQWQLNDLRSVDSVSINQTALSCSPPFFLSLFLPLDLISPCVSIHWAGRGRFVLPLRLSLLFSVSLSLPLLLHLSTIPFSLPFFHMLSDSSLDWTVFISSSSPHW